MSGIQVLCIGELLFDYLADQAGIPLPEVASWTAYPGGAPANVACALVKLGTSAGFIGCVGWDADGDALIAVLEDLHVNLAGLQRHPTAPTRNVFVTRSTEGDRTFAGFGATDTTAFADTRLQAADLPELLFQGAKFLVLGTLELAYADSRAALHRSLELARKHRLQVFVDVNWRPVFWPHPEDAKPLIADVLRQADFIKLSVEEAEWLFGSPEPQTVAVAYPQVQGVLATAGELGCRYWFPGGSGEIPAYAVAVVDTTGAGDAFSAGLLHQLCSRPQLDLADSQSVQSIVRYASAVGALTTTQPGAIAAQPTAETVDLFLGIL
ncbi:MAG: carbohydrate kinase [Thermosynechococcaceae cyanobacterium]